MASQAVGDSDEEEYHSLPGQGPEYGEDGDNESFAEPPVHPVPTMQGAFEESIIESMEGDDAATASPSSNAETRRQNLLDAEQYDDSWKTRWKQRPGAQYHPLLKLMAQIIFGVHLLQQEQAKSNEEVVKILQTHVNEVDSFLEQASDDFDLAIGDIEERMQHLRLPMQHPEVFTAMLDDKSFRTQLLEGNEKIEKIIDVTTKAMEAAITDIETSQHATQELRKYLDSTQSQWPRHRKEILDVYGAMRGNEQGWIKYLKDLRTKGDNLGNALVQLDTVIGDMSKMAAAASRRNKPTGDRRTSPSRSAKSAPSSPGLRSKFSHQPPPMPEGGNLLINKPLPKEPDAEYRAAQVAVPKLHPVPFSQRYERPRESPRSPQSSNKRTSGAPHSNPQRPKFAKAPRNAQPSKADNADLVKFLRSSGPLHSNPPDHKVSRAKSEASAEKKLARSQGRRADEVRNAANAATTPRSKTRGGDDISSRGMRSGSANRKSQKLHSAKSEPSKRNSVLTSTGFARRISKRIERHPIAEKREGPSKKSPVEAAEAAPTDSAHESGASQIPAASQKVEEPLQTSSERTRSQSRLGLFPKTSASPPPPAADARHDEGTEKPASTGPPLPNPSVASLPSSDANKTTTPSPALPRSRSLSIRKIFHRKGESRNLFT